MYPFFFDPTMVIIIPGLIFAFWAQWKVKSTFERYSRQPSEAGYTGAQVARAILDGNGLANVKVDATPGHLTDHYHPTRKELKLSESNYAQRSVASLAVAAHEAGHALQDRDGYSPMRWRASLVPVANIGSQAGIPLAIVGFFFQSGVGIFLINLGIALYMAALIFHVVTLPVEFDASRRALAALEREGYLSAREMPAAKQVLNAAALTYVASAAVAALNLIRLFMLRSMANR